MPRHEASEGAGVSPRGPELCSSSRSCRERFHCVILGWPSGKAWSLWHLCEGSGEAALIAGQTSAPQEPAAAWSPSKAPCREGCSAPRGFCTLSVSPPAEWEEGQQQHLTNTGAAGQREVSELSLVVSRSSHS